MILLQTIPQTLMTPDSVILAALAEPFGTLVRSIIYFVQIYLTLLIIRILLGWFPQVNWGNPVLSTLSQLTDPYLNLFRGLIPTVGMLDFSCILGFLLLQFIVYVLSPLA
jgi:YggT family protein